MNRHENTATARRTKSMTAAYTINGKCYDPPAAVYCTVADGIERPLNILSFFFSETTHKTSKITLNITTLVPRLDQNGKISSLRPRSLLIECWAWSITNWRSYPLESGTSLPSDFNTPEGYVTTEAEPKRIIYFQVARFKVHERSPFSLQNLEVEGQMEGILEDLNQYSRTRTPLNFICIVNEYRKTEPSSPVSKMRFEMIGGFRYRNAGYVDRKIMALEDANKLFGAEAARWLLMLGISVPFASCASTKITIWGIAK